MLHEQPRDPSHAKSDRLHQGRGKIAMPAGKSTPYYRHIVLALTLSFVLTSARSQTSQHHTIVPPSNRQLASPEIERKVSALLGKMTVEEKLGQLVQYNTVGATSATVAAGQEVDLAANPEANYRLDPMQLAQAGKLGSMLNVTGGARISSYQHAAVEKGRLHIPLLFGADVIHGYRTIYPVPLGLAASFDPQLVTQLSRMAAEEATTAGIRWFYSPMVDISRDARWGRTTEGAGEDPYLGSAMAGAYIRGYQSDTLNKPDSVAASVKHFAAYGAVEAGREYNTTDMSELQLRQVYLPPYHAAVEAGAATVMSAFNSLNGVPASANPFLLQTILRDEWGFDGLVVSDYTAIMELTLQGIAINLSMATEKTITAGVDIDMMSHYYDAALPALVKSGRVPMAVVDEAVRRVLRVKFALGLFEHPFTEGPEVTGAVAEHRPLARRAAEESLVLLQNNDALLPLNPATKRIALIGPLADDSSDMLGAWSGANNFGDVRTLRATMAERAQQSGATVTYEKGTGISGTSGSGFAAAVSATQNSDVTILALGESSDMTG